VTSLPGEAMPGAAVFWVNGCPAPLDLRDRGLAYGDGLFETMRCQAGRIPLLPWHIERLLVGAKRLRIPADAAQISEELAAFVHSLSADGSAPTGVIKLLYTRGLGGAGYAPPLHPKPQRILSFSPGLTHSIATETGIALVISAWRLPHNSALAGIKHLNRLDYVMAAAEPLAEGQQWLLLDAAERPIESLHHNIFWREGSQLCTPRLDLCGVAGVMRRWVMAQAHDLGLDMREEFFDLPSLLNAEEVFLSNSLRGIWPVRQCQQQCWSDWPLVRQLQQRSTQLWG
jgi:4-amino-4-deoxychorismate lyase